VSKSGYQSDMKLDNIHVLGVNTGPSSVTVNGQKASFKYNADTKVSLTGSVSVTDWGTRQVLNW